ncbi:hypothetical protein M1D88_13210 [Arthrobacter sp. R1-13]
MTGDLFTVRVHEESAQITSITLQPAACITTEDCFRASSERRALTRGKPGAILLIITGVGAVSREAISGYCDGETLTALAILGNSPVDEVIANAILRRLPIECEARYFTSEGDALSWLQNKGCSVAMGDNQSVS